MSNHVQLYAAINITNSELVRQKNFDEDLGDFNHSEVLNQLLMNQQTITLLLLEAANVDVSSIRAKMNSIYYNEEERRWAFGD